MISRDGASTDPQKKETVKKYPVPTTPTEIRCFLGLVLYYRKGFSKIAKPLYSLTCKDVVFD